MSYDFEGTDPGPPPRQFPIFQANDLEAIVMLLELAAILLTSSPGVTFTFEQLFTKAQEVGGDEITLNETDVRIVVSTSRFLKKEPGRRFSLR